MSASTFQFWAEKGLLGEAHQTWPGGGGSEVAYSADALEIARIIAFLPRGARRRSDVVLACFSRGVAVTVAEFREALMDEIEAIQGAGGQRLLAAEGEDAVLDAADDIAASWVARRRRPPVLRRWERNSKGWVPAGSDATAEADAMGNDERLRFMLSAVLAAIGGEPSNLEPAIGGLLAAVGAGPAVDAAEAESGRHPLDIEAETAKAATVVVDRLRHAATVEMEEMTQARGILLALARLGADDEAVTPFEGPLAPLGSACQLVAMSALALAIMVRHGTTSFGELAEALSAAGP